MDGANIRRFNRILLRADARGEHGQRKTGSADYNAAMRFGTKSAKAVRSRNLTRLEREVLAKNITSTALRNVKAKQMLSAKQYTQVMRTIEKYLHAGMARNELAMDKHLQEILDLCGPDKAEKIVNEVKNARAIVAGWVE